MDTFLLSTPNEQKLVLLPLQKTQHDAHVGYTSSLSSVGSMRTDQIVTKFHEEPTRRAVRNTSTNVPKTFFYGIMDSVFRCTAGQEDNGSFCSPDVLIQWPFDAASLSPT
ncbi:unnamed protein product [Pleuronectes platessa]|uniref:Uncharacterized protein n=1 Tax=Pleuronectes platessa TaxID=8262 RepID=A0A9N7YTJ8_PLEPL|nr:unnamed protein product [Pleuronectes platessa]